jgi:rubrerythrin
METRERLIELIKKQIEIERENVRQVNETEKKVDNAASKLSLLEIRLDSQKHADILSGILEVLNDVPSSETLWEHRISSYIDPFVVSAR